MKLTIDIGGTNIRLALWSDGKIVQTERFKTNPDDFEASLDQVILFVNGFDNIDAIAGGMPGPANYEKGIFINPPNLKGWWGKDLKTYLMQKTGIKNIKFQNDAKLMALANHKRFGYKKSDVTQFFTVSTGLGAGLIIEDKIFDGAFGMAQEIAHLPVNTFEEPNKYSKGAVEWYASGGGLEARAKMLIDPKITTVDLFKLFEEKNEKAIEIVNQGIESLANLIAISTAFINPTSIIFDGSVARKSTWFVEKAVEIAKNRVYPQQAKTIKIHISELGDDSTLIGAYYLIEN